jgi:hypothetical protein
VFPILAQLTSVQREFTWSRYPGPTRGNGPDLHGRVVETGTGLPGRVTRIETGAMSGMPVFDELDRFLTEAPGTDRP